MDSMNEIDRKIDILTILSDINVLKTVINGFENNYLHILEESYDPEKEKAVNYFYAIVRLAKMAEDRCTELLEEIR